MNLRKLIYKCMLLKNKNTYEVIVAISIVFSMVLVFTNMSSMIQKAILAAAENGANYNMILYNLKESDAELLYEDMHTIDGYKYSYVRTDDIFCINKDDKNFNYFVVGLEGDIEVYGYSLVEGRKPENENEIIVSNFYKNDLSTTLELGNVIELYPKNETSNVLGESISKSEYEKMQDNEIISESEKYEIVGFFENPTANDSFQVEVFSTIDGYKRLCSDKNIPFSVCFYTDAANEKAFNESIDQATEIMGENHVAITDPSDIVINEDRLSILSDKTASKGTAKLFMLLSLLLSVSGFFMIFNIIYSTIDDKVRLYKMLRSLGFSKKKMFKYYFETVLIIGIIGNVLGILIGMGLNNIIGRKLVISLCSSFVMNSFGNIIFQNNIIAYIEAGIMLMVVVISSNLIIWKKINKLTLIDEIKYNLPLNKKTKDIKEAKIIKNIFSVIGNRNIKRNKILSICLFLNFVLVGIIFCVVCGVLFDVNPKNFIENSKSEVADYIISFDSLSMEFIDESELSFFQDKFGVENVHSIYENPFQFMTMDNNVDKDDTVFLFVADNSVLSNLSEIFEYKDENEPLIMFNKVGFEELTIRRNDDFEKIVLPIDGSFNVNYLASFSIDSECEIVMNKAAFEKYIGDSLKTTSLFINSSLLNKEFENEVKSITDEIERKVYIYNTHNDEDNPKKQIETILLILVYLCICLIIMVAANMACIIRINIKQRKKEFGIYRAIGMPLKKILKLLVYEEKVLCLYSFVPSIIVGAITSVYLVGAAEYDVNILKILTGIIISCIFIYLIVLTITKIMVNNVIKYNIMDNLED